MSKMDEEYVERQLSWNRQVVQHALDDPVFRTELLSDPKRALERKLGTLVPNAVEVRVLRQNARQLYVVLPHIPSDDEGEGEVDVEQLGSVTGGITETRGSWTIPLEDETNPF